MPSVAFVVADEDAHVATFHGVGYAVQENVAAVATVGGSQTEDVAVAGVGLHALPSSLGAPGLAAVGGVVVATCPALADADKHPAVGQFHQFSFVPAAVGAVGHLPRVAVVVAVDHKVVQCIAVALAAHGGGEHDAAGMLSACQPEAVARAKERSTVVAADRIGGPASPKLFGDVLGCRPCLPTVGAAAHVAADGIGLGRGEKTVPSHKHTHHVAILTHHQSRVAEAVLAARTLGNGDGLAPCAAVVGAAARDDVDVLGEVGLVVFAAVAGDEEGAVGQAADSRNAPVGTAVVPRTEQALLVIRYRLHHGRVVRGGGRRLIASPCNKREEKQQQGFLHDLKMIVYI